MTDYNDGKWHGWNGGECPVHPKTKVYGMEPRNICWHTFAEDCDWGSFRGAFRVTKEHKEPREFWIARVADDGSDCLLGFKPADEGYYDTIIHVREVLE